MPRGSMPGERRGGRKLQTPNRRTVLTDRILALAESCHGLALVEFLGGLAKDKQLPADTRVAVLKSLSSRSGRKHVAAGINPVTGARRSERRRPKRIELRSLTRMNRQQLEGLFLVVSDTSAARKDRRKAALVAASLLLPVEKNQRKWGALKDRFGIAINPGIAREYRDIKLRLETLRNGRSGSTPIVLVEIRKLKARKDIILDRVECPCPSIYGVKDILEDRLRLNRFQNKLKRGVALTDEEDAEEAHRQLRVDLYENSPEMAARRHRKLLADLESQEQESRILKEANPNCMSRRAKGNLRFLRFLYPDPALFSSSTDHSSHDEFMATLHGFENAKPDEDGNIYPPDSKLRPSGPNGTERPVDGSETASVAPDSPGEEYKWYGDNLRHRDDPVDLKAWLRGKDYLAGEVRDAARALLGKYYPKVYPDLVIDCVKAKLVPEQEVRPDFRKCLSE
jgi:hypothetical protein